jgi:hypothetical protein
MNEPGLELNEVFQAVRERVLAQTSGRQTPWESSSKTGQFFFRPGTVPTGRIFGGLGVAESARVGIGLELDFGPVLGLSLGGDVRGSAGFPAGFEGLAHGNYTFASGLAVGVQAGYSLLSRTYAERDLTLTPVGKPPSTSKVEERHLPRARGPSGSPAPLECSGRCRACPTRCSRKDLSATLQATASCELPPI